MDTWYTINNSIYVYIIYPSHANIKKGLLINKSNRPYWEYSLQIYRSCIGLKYLKVIYKAVWYINQFNLNVSIESWIFQRTIYYIAIFPSFGVDSIGLAGLPTRLFPSLKQPPKSIIYRCLRTFAGGNYFSCLLTESR